MNSKRLENPDILNWLSKVDTLLMDECQEINNSQKELIDKYLYNCTYRFGFSASTDKFTGLDLTSLHNLWNINPVTYDILERFGPAIVYKAPQKKIRVVETPVFCGNYRNYYSYDKCVNQVCHSTAFPRYVERCINDNNKFGRSTILFPFTNSNHIHYLMEEPNLKKYHIIMWKADGIEHNNGEPYERGADLSRVKELINGHQVDLVFASSVGFKGVDFDQLKAVMFVTASSYGMVTQILGRIFRYTGDGYPTVYLLHNRSDNPLFNASYKKRRDVIMRNDHIYETLSLF